MKSALAYYTVLCSTFVLCKWLDSYLEMPEMILIRLFIRCPSPKYENGFKHWRVRNPSITKSYLEALELILLLLLPYLGCSDSVWLIIRLFFTVNSLSRYRSIGWDLVPVPVWGSGKEVPRSRRWRLGVGTFKYDLSREYELLRGILKFKRTLLHHI